MKTVFLFVCFLFLGLSYAMAQNQDSVAIKKFYEENTIYWNGSTKYIKNFQSYPLRTLKQEIQFSPDAIHEYKEYRSDYNIARATLLASSVLLVSGILVKDHEVKLGLLSCSIITATISIPFSLNANKHLGRAIWLHNRDVLLR